MKGGENMAKEIIEVRFFKENLEGVEKWQKKVWENFPDDGFEYKRLPSGDWRVSRYRRRQR